MNEATILIGDVRQRLKELPEQSVQCCITSPPYWGLRDYGKEEQIGLEQSPSEYVSELVKVFDEVWRVLKDDGVLWLNLGDSYAGNNSRASTNGRAGFGTKREGVFTKTGDGIKPKDLVGIPWRVAFALQDAGWYLRQDIIWSKPNPMPESVKDRCVKSHEYLFLLAKNKNYYFDHLAIQEPAVDAGTKFIRNNGSGTMEARAIGRKTSGNERPGVVYENKSMRNKRSVWTVAPKPFRGAHFAVMPEALVQPCVLASSTEGDTILDPFTGSGTVAVVALAHNRNFIGTELNSEYAMIAEQRISSVNPMFNIVSVKQ